MGLWFAGACPSRPAAGLTQPSGPSLWLPRGTGPGWLCVKGRGHLGFALPSLQDLSRASFLPGTWGTWGSSQASAPHSATCSLCCPFLFPLSPLLKVQDRGYFLWRNSLATAKCHPENSVLPCPQHLPSLSSSGLLPPSKELQIVTPE